MFPPFSCLVPHLDDLDDEAEGEGEGEDEEEDGAEGQDVRTDPRPLLAC
jgi:hypothetical protein